jgi:3-deoxy-manno-octulosonate cytidylyltransferase (CMP-KDO synthetase)
MIVKIIGLIPARFESNRFPGKPLELIEGIPMFAHVYFRSKLANLDEVYVCTDSIKILTKAKELKIPVILTSKNHKNGTDRCAEAVSKLSLNKSSLVLNIQGDEPLIQPSIINKLIKNFDPVHMDILFPYLEIKKRESLGYVKIVSNKKNKVLYMSRSDVPKDFRKKVVLKSQVGVTMFTQKALKIFSEHKSENEHIEGIELLRVLETNLDMYCFKTIINSKSVDYPEDLKFVRKTIKNDPHLKKYNNFL